MISLDTSMVRVEGRKLLFDTIKGGTRFAGFTVDDLQHLHVSHSIRAQCVREASDSDVGTVFIEVGKHWHKRLAEADDRLTES